MTAKAAMVREHLEQVRRLLKGRGFEAFVLHHGRPFTGAPRPKGMRRHRRHACFDNCLHLMTTWPAPPQRSLIYCEGYAAGIIPVWHAWLVTPDGTVVDPTWEKPEECAYFGVPFRAVFVREVAVETKLGGVFYARSERAQQLAQRPKADWRDIIEAISARADAV